MKRALFVIGYLLSTTVLQATPCLIESLCPSDSNPLIEENQFYQKLYFSCGCGGGGVDGNAADEIPPDQA
jgi:hypothetical protein